MERVVRHTFVGRERDLHALRAGLDDAASGPGRLFLLSSESGVGKTRLADEFTVVARRQGARVLWGHCWASEGAPSLSGFQRRDMKAKGRDAMHQSKVVGIQSIDRCPNTQTAQSNENISGQQRDAISQVPMLLKETGLDTAGLHPIAVGGSDYPPGFFIGAKVARIEPFPLSSSRSLHQFLGDD